MRLGCGLPMLGPGAGPDSLTRGDANRGPLSGSAAQVRGDLGRLRDAGVIEMMARTGSATLDGFGAGLGRFHEAEG